MSSLPLPAALFQETLKNLTASAHADFLKQYHIQTELPQAIAAYQVSHNRQHTNAKVKKSVIVDRIAAKPLTKEEQMGIPIILSKRELTIVKFMTKKQQEFIAGGRGHKSGIGIRTLVMLSIEKYGALERESLQRILVNVKKSKNSKNNYKKSGAIHALGVIWEDAKLGRNFKLIGNKLAKK